MRLDEALGSDLLSRRLLLRRAVGVGVGLPTAAGLLASCGGSDDDTQDTADGSVGGPASKAQIAELGWAMQASIVTLDLAKGFLPDPLIAATLGLETLLTLDPETKLEPWLATLDEPDPRTLVFTLRDGVTFTDGSPLTPGDVVFSWRRHTQPKLASQLGSYLLAMDSVEQTGAKEVTIRLSDVDPLFKYNAFFVHIFSEAHARKAGDKLGSPEGGVLGTGMYTYEDFRPNTGLTCVRNESYWGTKPRAKKIELQVIADADTQRLAAQEGSVVGAFAIAFSQTRRWNAARVLEAGQAPGLTSTFLSFGVNEAPWDDPQLRKAVAYCLDRKGLVNALLGGNGEPASSISTRGHWRAVLGEQETSEFLASLPQYSFDLEKARAALKQSSQPQGFETEMKVSTADTDSVQIALSLKENLGKIGVDLEVREVGDDALTEELYTKHAPGLFVATFYPVYPDPMDYLGIALAKSGTAPGGFNLANFTSPEIERLIRDQARAEGAERADLLKQIAVVAAEDLPYAPVFWQDYTVGLRRDYRLQRFDAFTPYRAWSGDLAQAA